MWVLLISVDILYKKWYHFKKLIRKEATRYEKELNLYYYWCANWKLDL